MQLLLIEDHKKTSAFIVQGLTEEGHVVDLREDGSAGLDAALSGHYDAVILDIMLPGMDGFAVVSALRQAGNATPVMMLTARNDVSDRVAGLDAGADDYLVKPFAFDELLARVRAFGRRRGSDTEYMLDLADLHVDLAKRKVVRGSLKLDLTAKEFDLLVFLMRNAGRVMTRTTIMEHVWDIHFNTGTNTIDVLVSYLRRKVDGPFELKLIHTVRGVGYGMRASDE